MEGAEMLEKVCQRQEWEAKKKWTEQIEDRNRTRRALQVQKKNWKKRKRKQVWELFCSLFPLENSPGLKAKDSIVWMWQRYAERTKRTTQDPCAPLSKKKEERQNNSDKCQCDRARSATTSWPQTMLAQLLLDRQI